MRSASKCPTRSLPPRQPDNAGCLRRQLADRARWVADAALALILAPACAACRTPLDRPTLGVVCAACWAAVHQILPPVCDACGDPLSTWRQAPSGRRCPRCTQRNGRVMRGRAIGPYDGSLRAIVHAFKYDGRRSLATPLAALLVRCGSEVLDDADLVVPVPLHRAKRRRRGFNQAEDLARRLPLPLVHALERRRSTPSQTDLPATARRANVEGAFGPARGLRIRGAVVVLVDDVSTTGATLEACARVLEQAGAREVRALTAARVVTTGQ